MSPHARPGGTLKVVLGADTGKQLADMKVGDKRCVSAVQGPHCGKHSELTAEHEPAYVTPWRGEQEASDTCVLTGGLSPESYA